jgi:hypothetical protein
MKRPVKVTRFDLLHFWHSSHVFHAFDYAFADLQTLFIMITLSSLPAPAHRVSSRAAHSVFERAVEKVGTDYLAQSLWDKYLDYELAQKDFANVTRLYSRVLAVPLDALAKYLERYANKMRDVSIITRPPPPAIPRLTS